MSPSIRQMVDEQRDAYRTSLNGLVTPSEELADREHDRDLEAERLERHAPASYEADHPRWRYRCKCGANVHVDLRACPLCGAAQ